MIADHPRIREHLAKIAELDDLEAQHRAKAREWGEYEEAVIAHAEENRRCLLEREQPPDPPEPPTEEIARDAAIVFANRRRALDEELRVIHAEIRPDVEAGAASREAELLDEIRPLAARLLPLVDRLNAEVLQPVRTVRQAADTVNPNSRPSPGSGLAHRTRQRVTLTDVLAVLADGGSVLDVGPPPRKPEDGSMVDSSPSPSYLTGPLGVGRAPEMTSYVPSQRPGEI